MKRGFITSARVISARRRSPPDSVYAALDATGVKPSSASRASKRARRSAALRSSVSRIAMMFCSTVESAEDRGLLRQIADAFARPDIHGVVGQIDAVQGDASRIRRGESDGHIKGRGLAGAVRTKQADDLTGIDFEADASNDGAATVGLGQFVCAESRGHHLGGVAVHLPPPLVCVRTSLLPSTRTLSDAFQKVNVLPLVSWHSPSTIFTGAPTTTYFSSAGE